MPAALSEHYSEEYINLSKNIAQKIQSAQEAESNSNIFTSIDEDIKTGQRLLDQMELEILALDCNRRIGAMTQLKSYRADLDRFAFDFKKIRKGIVDRKRAEEAKQLLFTGSKAIAFEDVESGLLGRPSDDSSNLLSDYEKFQAANDRLDRTTKMAIEAEQIGASVLSDLRMQREQIMRAGRNLEDADQDLDRSNRLLREMLRRMAANRIITTMIIVLLVAAIMLVLYYKLFH